MPVPDYSVLKGTITAGSVQQPDPNKPPHYHLAVTAGSRTYDVAVNIESQDQSEVLYQVSHDFQPPDPRGLLHLEVGMNPLASRPNGLALDFIREHLVQRQEMQLLQFDARHPLNSFHNDIDNLVHAAIGDPTAQIYAFGSQYPDGRGIHDIHMNQGNPRHNHGRDNGVWQDGAVFLYFPARDQWFAIFVAFQTQLWDTDDRGNPAPGRLEALAAPEVPT